MKSGWKKPGLLAIEIKNASGSVHNFTLKDPRGNVLKNRDISPGGTVIVNVELPDPGVYKFYCNKHFHTDPGDEGTYRRRAPDLEIAVLAARVEGLDLSPSTCTPCVLTFLKLGRIVLSG